jgi:hypothetical protein
MNYSLILPPSTKRNEKLDPYGDWVKPPSSAVHQIPFKSFRFKISQEKTMINKIRKIKELSLERDI